VTAAVAVAASGGRDSTALLHATARTARDLGLRVHALHVHHGLVPEADAWQQHLTRQCRRWAQSGLPLALQVHRLTESPPAGESVEAWARRQRYRALAAMARNAGCSLVLLAHHRRDQAETLLLQALRGGGPAGLAAMPRTAIREGLTWARPWLDLPREAVEAYVRRHRLGYVDDSSNDSLRFARNRLRHAVWPALSAAFPDAEAQLRSAAARAAEAAACLDELAVLDLQMLLEGDALKVEGWRLLSPARQRLTLRAWLRRRSVPESLVQRLAEELPAARQGRWPAPAGELLLHDGQLRFSAPGSTQQAISLQIDLSLPGVHEVPSWGGHFVVESVLIGGIEIARLRRALLHAREGGEQFQFGPDAIARGLKKQFQSRRIPAWERDGPLLFDGTQLLYVPGLGIDARALADAGSVQVRVSWASGRRQAAG
jgi:tRNA(Ile)-lysidine synthase